MMMMNDCCEIVVTSASKEQLYKWNDVLRSIGNDWEM